MAGAAPQSERLGSGGGEAPLASLGPDLPSKRGGMLRFHVRDSGPAPPATGGWKTVRRGGIGASEAYDPFVDRASPTVVQSAAEVAGALAPHTAEPSADIYQLIAREIPQLRTDSRVLDLLEASVAENVATVLHILQHDLDLDRVHAPAAAQQYGRRLAQRGIPWPRCCGPTASARRRRRPLPRPRGRRPRTGPLGVNPASTADGPRRGRGQAHPTTDLTKERQRRHRRYRHNQGPVPTGRHRQHSVHRSFPEESRPRLRHPQVDSTR
jgi:hypothetical protein